jgi:hypothetical protein
MDVSRQWRDQWPPQTAVQGVQNLRLRPIAVEVVIDTEEFGKLRRVFEVPT